MIRWPSATPIRPWTSIAAAGRDAGDPAAAEPDDRDHAGAVVQLGLEGRYAAARAQRDRAQGAAQPAPARGRARRRSVLTPVSAYVLRRSRACWSRAVRPPADAAPQPALLGHAVKPRPGAAALRRALAGSVSGSGSPDGHRRARRGGRRPWRGSSSQSPAASGLDGRAGRGTWRAASSAAPLTPTIRDGCWAVRPSPRCTVSWQTSSVPKRPSRSVAVPPRRAMSAASWGRTSVQRSPLRGAAKARSSRAPSGPASTHRLHGLGRLVDLEPQLAARLGRDQQRAEVDPLDAVVAATSSTSNGPVGRATRRPRSRPPRVRLLDGRRTAADLRRNFTAHSSGVRGPVRTGRSLR